MSEEVADVERTLAVLMSDGIAHHAAGRLSAAADAYARAVALDPRHGDAWRLMGVVALQSGDGAAARELLERALRMNAGDAAAHSALGSVAEADADVCAAHSAYSRAVALDPSGWSAVAGLMRMSVALGRPAQADQIGSAAISRGAREPALLRALGVARLQLRDYLGAARVLLAALEVVPHADAFANLGAACVHLGRSDAALRACRGALEIDPAHAEAANNLGIAHKARGEYTIAIAAFEQAIALGCQAAHANLGALHLLLGDYRAGWPHYGWAGAEREANPALHALPMWDGSAAPGLRLLVWPEQGIGDTLQMARFASTARSRVGSLTLACPRGTRDLLGSLAGPDRLIDAQACPDLSGFDCWIPLPRLPVVFDVRPESIPAGSYLRADPRRRADFLPSLAGRAKLRVGLVWSGNPQHEWDELRSCGLLALEPLAEIDGITWFALQQGQARYDEPARLTLSPINAQVHDFADTAAIIAELDLVITIDTAVAHLAGALGRPAWVLLAYRPDWRWGLCGERSSWYPSLRLFRAGDDGWDSAVARIGVALRAWIDERSSNI